MTACRDIELGLACYTGADGVRVSLNSNHVYDADGALFALYYTDAAGTVVDTSGGTVEVGACPVAAPDVEWDQFCDVAADGTVTYFMCRTITSFDTAGDVIDPVQVDYFETDKITAYVPSGTIGDCGACPPETPLGLITDLSALASRG